MKKDKMEVKAVEAPEMDKYQVESDAKALKCAEEIKADAKRFKAATEYLKKEKGHITSIEGLRQKYNDMASGEDES